MQTKLGKKDMEHCPILPGDCEILNLLAMRQANSMRRDLQILEIGHGLSTTILAKYGTVDVVDIYPPRIVVPKNVTFFIKDSRKFTPDKMYDFVFIDGDHRYPFIKADIENTWPALRIAGIMSGHDYDSDTFKEEYAFEDYVAGKHHGVIKAVNEMVPNLKRADERKSTIWWTRKY